MPYAKGVYDLSERINKFSAISDWTLLALRDKWRNSFNNHDYAAYSPKTAVRSNTNFYEQQRTT